MKLNSNVGVIIGIVVLCAGLLFIASFARAPEPATPFPAVRADDHVKGATSSPVVLVEYLDFECEACGAYYPIVKQMEEEFGDRVTFVARYFPLPGHKNGLPAALAVEAASRQGKFWEMHNLMFDRQKDWGEKQVETPEVFEGFALELGLNMEQFKADVASEEVLARVMRDMEEGKQAGANSTPTFFLNGMKIQNPQSSEAFRALLQSQIDKAGS